jgi:hypothetical protein
MENLNKIAIKKYKRLLIKDFNNEKTIQLFSFISQKITEEMLLGNKIIPLNLVDLIYNLDYLSIEQEVSKIFKVTMKNNKEKEEKSFSRKKY